MTRGKVDITRKTRDCTEGSLSRMRVSTLLVYAQCPRVPHPALTAHSLVLLLPLMLLSVTMDTAHGTRSARSVLPLMGRESRLEPPRGNPGCRLGEQFYDLEETWSPDLEPVGVMHCIVCQCQRVVKKGILQSRGRVNCRNIKHSCPPVNCTNPELKPGQCCKLCEGQDPFLAHALSLKRFPSFRFRSDTEFTVAAAPKVVHRPSRSKEYLSMMVGAHAPVPTSTSGVARGRFTLRDAALYFSIQFKGTERPRQFRVLDRGGAVLFMHDVNEQPENNEITINSFNVNAIEPEAHCVLWNLPNEGVRLNGRICGVWRPLHSEHAIKLNEGHLIAVLSTAEVGGGLIGGKIISHRALTKESFSAVLQRPHQQATGSGGIAMVTIAGNGDVNFIIKMAGISIPAGVNRTVRVRFQKGSRTLHEATGELLGPDLEFGEVWTDLSTRESRMLARGAVSINVMTSQGVVFSGDVTVKQTCNALHAVMSGGAAMAVSRASGAAGSALVRLTPGGTLHYQIHLVGMQSPVTDIAFEMAPTKRGRTRRLCRVTSQFSRRPNSLGGWANGTCDKLNSRHVHALFHGEVFVNVVTRDVALSALRGAVNELLYNPAVDKINDPGTILAGRSMSPPANTDVGGNLWTRLDDACALHYELVISGLSEGEDAVLTAQLVTLPPQGGRQPQGTANFTLEEFLGNLADGMAPTLTPVLYQHLASGRLLLRVTTKSQPTGVIGGKLHIPNRCVAKGSQSNTLGILDDQEDVSQEQRHRECVIDDVIYKDGDVWVPNNTEHKCATCHCKGGQEECHATVCPEPTCRNPVKLEGECCLQCPNVSTTDRQCYFDGDKRWHRYGTRWHPYMPPFGYMTCAVCSCTEGAAGSKGAVGCSRRACPPLACPDAEAVRMHPADCCKTCPDRQNTSSSLDGHNIQGDISMAGRCAFRGQHFAHGVRWHPRVQPFGQLACVTCRCHSGTTQCHRQRCPKLSCNRKVFIDNRCCPVCDTNNSDSDRESPYSNHRKRTRKMT